MRLLFGLVLLGLPSMLHASELNIRVDGSLSLKAAISKAAKDYRGQDVVRISVASGTYVADQAIFSWFLAANAHLIIEAESGARPVFDGQGTNSTFMAMRARGGHNTRLSILGLEIRNYRSAIVLQGGNSNEQWLGGARIANNIFLRIGQMHDGQKVSYSVIGLVNARDNHITDNFFVSFHNREQCGGLHAVYMAHGSTGNIVDRNTFEDTCSVTIKVRDGSNNNKVVHNTFIRNFGGSLFVDSFCDLQRQKECRNQECPSWGNEFKSNVLDDHSAKIVGVAIRWPHVPADCPHPNLPRTLVD